MTKLNSVFYDIYKSYDDNYRDGPLALKDFKKIQRSSLKKHSFLGFPINLPFGIPSGPLLILALMYQPIKRYAQTFSRAILTPTLFMSKHQENFTPIRLKD